ncbi:MAG: maleylpyruvate isomerase family mycothiol-dependent enzyme [Ilumatobacteraceae bacterium]
MTDLGVLHRASRLRVGELVAGADPSTEVPATPGWSVHDVVAHLVGVAEDATSGNMEGAPGGGGGGGGGGGAWTAAQVERGRGKSVEQLLARWNGVAPGMEAALSSADGLMSSAAVLDVNTHEADLRHALGLPPAPDPAFLAWAAPLMRTIFAGAVEGAGLPSVTVEATDYECFRSHLGRRTRAEAAALGWSADPEPYLDAWFIFGPAPSPSAKPAAERPQPAIPGLFE